MASYGTLAASTLVLVLGSVVLTVPAFGQAAEDTVAVTLQAAGNSGVSGNAVLRARGRETDFDYSLTATDQARQRQEYNLWLREGSCAAPRRKLDDLDEVRADGRPEREDEEVALSDLLATEHVLQVRVDDRMRSWLAEPSDETRDSDLTAQDRHPADPPGHGSCAPTCA